MAAPPERGVIATWRNVLVLAAIAAALAIAALAGGRGAPGPVDRAVLPGFTAATELHWKHGARDLVVTKVPGGTWQLASPRAAADPRAIENVIATLRGARWHRRGERDRAGTIHGELDVAGHRVEFGDPIPGADQSWIVVDGTALLVDGWVARALDPDPLALRDRTPLAGATAAPSLVIESPAGSVTIAGTPRRVAGMIVRPELVDALQSALAAVTIVRAPDGPVPVAADATRLAFAPHQVAIGGPCPGDPHLLALHADTGDGCVDPARWHDVTAAVTVLAGPPEQIVDPRPVGFPIARLDLAGGAIDLAHGATVTIAGHAHGADPDRVAALVAALGEPATLVPVPAGTPETSFAIVPAHGDPAPIVYDVHGDIVVRRGEPRGLRLRARLDLAPADYLDPTRWMQDPTTLASLTLDGVRYDRGAALGEWTRTPAGTVDPALVDAVVTAASQLRAPARADRPVAVQHRLAVTFAPPVGPPETHTLELGAPGPDGCPATVDRAPVTAPLALCTAVAALAR